MALQEDDSDLEFDLKWFGDQTTSEAMEIKEMRKELISIFSKDKRWMIWFLDNGSEYNHLDTLRVILANFELIRVDAPLRVVQVIIRELMEELF